MLASNLDEPDRLSRMIENILLLAQTKHSNFAKQRLEFNVADELHRIAEYFEGIADKEGVYLVVSGGECLSADVELFRRAVNNLLANVVRFTPRDGAIPVMPTSSKATGCFAAANHRRDVATSAFFLVSFVTNLMAYSPGESVPSCIDEHNWLD